jgi:hypothetical protein
MAEPDATLLALEAAPDSALDPWALAEELWRRGWWVDRQGPPPSIHLTVNAIHGRVLEEFLGDLCAAVGGGTRGGPGWCGRCLRDGGVDTAKVRSSHGDTRRDQPASAAVVA